MPAESAIPEILNPTEKVIDPEFFRYSVITSTSNDALYEDVNLNSALEESISAHYAALKARGITPKITFPDVSVQRRLDQKAISRIIGNILDNAIKYSDGDLSIILRESGEIVFTNAARDLDPVTVGKLFNRFFTVESGRDATGLGLSIARVLTERMGGAIAADYASGRLLITVLFQ